MTQNNNSPKVLEVMKDNIPYKTAYFIISDTVDKYFEGKTAFKDVKKWAKEKGYDQVLNVATRMGQKDKLHNL
jgi:hypothetical protein